MKKLILLFCVAVTTFLGASAQNTNTGSMYNNNGTNLSTAPGGINGQNNYNNYNNNLNTHSTSPGQNNLTPNIGLPNQTQPNSNPLGNPQNNNLNNPNSFPNNLSPNIMPNTTPTTTPNYNNPLKH